MRINLLIAVVAVMVATPLFAAETTTPQSNALSSQGPGTGTAGQPGSKGHPTLTEDGNANLQPGKYGRRPAQLDRCASKTGQ